MINIWTIASFGNSWVTYCDINSNMDSLLIKSWLTGSGSSNLDYISMTGLCNYYQSTVCIVTIKLVIKNNGPVISVMV